MENNNNSNILFKYKDRNLESFISFDDDDLLIFLVNEDSILYDGKSLEPINHHFLHFSY